MTIVPISYINSVVSISAYNEYLKVNENLKVKEILGSGFIYGRFVKEFAKEKELNLYEYVLVTNRHVIEKSSEIYVTAGHNKQELKLEVRKYKKGVFFETASPIWVEHPSTDKDLDLVVIPLNYPEVKKVIDNVDFIRSESNVLKTNKMKEKGISEGDSISVLGFPKDIFYDTKIDLNNPKRTLISRTGSIANIQELYDDNSDQFIVDAPIFPGNSGGPVLSNIELISADGTDKKIVVSVIGIVSDLYSYEETSSGRLSSIKFSHNSDLGAVYPIDLIDQIIDFYRGEVKEYTDQLLAEIKELTSVDDLENLIIHKVSEDIKTLIKDNIKENAPELVIDKINDIFNDNDVRKEIFKHFSENYQHTIKFLNDVFESEFIDQFLTTYEQNTAKKLINELEKKLMP